MTRVKVTVMNRKGVFNPEGKVVFNGLRRLGHEVEDVKVGKIIALSFDSEDQNEIRKEVEKMCGEFLVNPVIETYTIDFIEDES